ncbi:MAG TPA: molybdopterin molybdotransferase MoeA [Candidatus Pelagibacter sp.]|jgi:molybdopterin molybdotransferase|nr:molybdopterin molybdotransferase MoeA [Candidatus Pelagibacter sp.]
MIKYKEAISIIKKISLKLTNEKISILHSVNRICDTDVRSPSVNPLCNNTAFDGFAVIAKETKGISLKNKKKFKIIKTIAAGDSPKIKNYRKNSAIEIMTGGLIPKKFDSVLAVEKAKYFPTKEKPTHIIIDKEVKKFSFIRFSGEDYKLNDLVVRKGEIIQPKHIMALTTLGIKDIKVKKKPKITFLSTGNEIVNYRSKNILPWQVRNSNNHYFKSLGENLHFNIVDGGTIKDRKSEKLKNILAKLKNSDTDIIVTTGAISAGRYDFLPEFISKFGFKKCFKGVSIKPGRPILLSKLKNNNKLFFGLPGNPISAAAGFRFFIYPLIRKSLGMETENKFTAKLSNKYFKVKNFTHFVRCFMKINNRGLVQLEVLKGQQSNRIKSFVKANCWGIFHEGKSKFKKGDIIEWVPLIPGR